VTSNPINRRNVLIGATALTAAAATAGRAAAQANPGAAAPAATLPARGEFVIRGANVLTMDPALGDLAVGDVYVRDGAIVAVAANVDAPSAEVIDGAGMICMPGFVETHWHLWTSSCRPVVREDNPKLGYFPVTATLGTFYQPEHSYRAVKHGLAEALYAGITTTHNWAHNVRSPAHADAELRAMRDVGIRGRFSYGTPQGYANDLPMDSPDLARVKQQWLPDNPLLTLGICSRNIGGGTSPGRGLITTDMAKRDWGAARDLGLPITMHTSSASPIKLLEEAGLLGPDVQLVHALLTTPEERQILATRGTSYSTAPQGESRRASKVGEIQLGELLDAGVKVSMSIDHIANSNCDCFSCMRTLYSLYQHRMPDPNKLTTKRLVQLATIDGAVALGLDKQVGSLTPGKRADIILIRTSDPNMALMGDPYDALVNLAQPGNVDLVVVDGRILRRGGQYTALDYKQVIADSGQTANELRALAKWT
jgi:cytosine/adenosine deaminase-related metal-dependent hydrolase